MEGGGKGGREGETVPVPATQNEAERPGAPVAPLLLGSRRGGGGVPVGWGEGGGGF